MSVSHFISLYTHEWGKIILLIRWVNLFDQQPPARYRMVRGPGIQSAPNYKIDWSKLLKKGQAKVSWIPGPLEPPTLAPMPDLMMMTSFT